MGDFNSDVLAKRNLSADCKGRNTRGDKSQQHVAATNRFVCTLIAATGCSDKSPGVNASTFGGKLIRILSPRQNFVAATCRTKLNQFDFVRHVAATKFCRGDKIFNKILLFTR